MSILPEQDLLLIAIVSAFFLPVVFGPGVALCSIATPRKVNISPFFIPRYVCLSILVYLSVGFFWFFLPFRISSLGWTYLVLATISWVIITLRSRLVAFSFVKLARWKWMFLITSLAIIAFVQVLLFSKSQWVNFGADHIFHMGYVTKFIAEDYAFTTNPFIKNGWVDPVYSYNAAYLMLAAFFGLFQSHDS